MDPTVSRLTSLQECRQYIANVTEKYPKLAIEARHRSIELRIKEHPQASDIERDVLMAVYAFDEVLFARHGKKTKSKTTWNRVQKEGVTKTVEDAIASPDDASGYLALKKLGLTDLTFEGVVLKYPESFSAKALGQATKRLANWEEKASS